MFYVVIDLICNVRNDSNCSCMTQTDRCISNNISFHSERAIIDQISPSSMSQDFRSAYEFGLKWLPYQRCSIRYCGCKAPSHELHITNFRQQGPGMTVWWVASSNKETQIGSLMALSLCQMSRNKFQEPVETKPHTETSKALQEVNKRCDYAVVVHTTVSWNQHLYCTLGVFIFPRIGWKIIQVICEKKKKFFFKK